LQHSPIDLSDKHESQSHRQMMFEILIKLILIIKYYAKELTTDSQCYSDIIYINKNNDLYHYYLEDGYA
jgi:hypothetical protein